jgi:peptidoglycan-N-acetylglucosamine deacetylase
MTTRAFLMLVALIGLLLPRSLTVERWVPVARAAPVPEKVIALSFDDVPRGPGAFLDPRKRAAMLITALAEADVVQALFFVNPGRIDSEADALMVDSYAAAGHVIANHSFTHPHLREVSAEAYLADIDKAEEWLKGRPGYRPWFRYPFLDEGGRDKAKRDAVRAGLAARGLSNGYVTVDGSDWNIEALAVTAKRDGHAIDMDALRDLYVETHVESAEFSHALAQRAVGRPIPHMLLLHETDLAALFIGDLVAALRAQGWVVVTADAVYADPIYRALPDTPFAAGTLTEQLAWEKGLPAPRWYARNDTDYAGRLFRERVLHQEVAQ